MNRNNPLLALKDILLSKHKRILMPLPIAIYSIKRPVQLTIDGDEKSIFDFLSLFGSCTNNQININLCIEKTPMLMDKIRNFIAKYKDNAPIANRLGSFIEELDDGEKFLVLPYALNTLDSATKMAIEKALYEVNHIAFCPDTPEAKETEKNAEELFKNYNFHFPDLNKKYPAIGAHGSNKICRFCNQSAPETTFKTKAHAISEALGNKKLILNEECDECNKFFSDNLERDFIAYIEPLLPLFGIEGKKKEKGNKIPKYTNKGAKISYDKDLGISISFLENHATYDDNDTSKPPQKITFPHKREIIPQNLYKTLCKYALSVLPTYQDVQDVQKTIQWIMGKTSCDKLPKIWTWFHPSVAKEPNICIYTRKNENTNLPHMIGEFHFACHAYLFIIPFSSKDNKDFIGEENFAEFLPTHARLKEFCKIQDFSSTTAQNAGGIVIEFQKRS